MQKMVKIYVKQDIRKGQQRGGNSIVPDGSCVRYDVRGLTAAARPGAARERNSKLDIAAAEVTGAREQTQISHIFLEDGRGVPARLDCLFSVRRVPFQPRTRICCTYGFPFAPAWAVSPHASVATV